jgi:hypothetical protein
MAAEAGAQGQIAASRRNVELKATDPFPVRSLAICHELEAEDLGLLHQRDTYFRVPRGRLKLREEYGRAWLIPYDRPDAAEARLSRYRLIDAPDPRALREGLEATLGPHVVVEKERRLFLWRGVRIQRLSGSSWNFGSGPVSGLSQTAVAATSGAAVSGGTGAASLARMW